jgi:hypothetical protein
MTEQMRPVAVVTSHMLKREKSSSGDNLCAGNKSDVSDLGVFHDIGKSPHGLVNFVLYTFLHS